MPVVGEYWSRDVNVLRSYLATVPYISLFDVPLHFKLFYASCSNGEVDLGALFNDTLVAADPERAVTFVENHDTQPGQSLESPVQAWFKPSAYALILLREQGMPCVFWGDLFGTPETGDLAAVTELPVLMNIRHFLAYGPQHDYFDDADVVGFTREGDDYRPASGVAVLFSDRRAGTKRMYVGRAHAGSYWTCMIGEQDTVQVDEEGWATFPVSDGGLSVYVPSVARELLDYGQDKLTRPRN